MELFTNDRHLTEQALQALLNGGLDDLQTLEAAEHIAACAHCAERLADAAARPETTRPAPRGMHEQIRGRLRRAEHGRRREFLRFCAAAVAGMAAAITLLFVAPMPHNAVPVAEPAPQTLPEPEKQTLPEPVKLVLPEPQEPAISRPAPEKDENGGADKNGQGSVLEQLNQYFQSLFSDAA